MIPDRKNVSSNQDAESYQQLLELKERVKDVLSLPQKAQNVSEGQFLIRQEFTRGDVSC